MYKRTATQWSSKGIKQLMSGESLNKMREGEYMYKRAATQWNSNSIKQLMSGESLNRRREGGVHV